MKLITLTSCLFALSFVACGGTEGPSSTTTSTMQTCTTRHACINGSCRCSEGPRKDSSCCDPDDSSCTVNKCPAFCEYCR